MPAPAVLSRSPFPATAASLEEVCAAGPRDQAARLAFALARRPEDDRRPVLLTAPRAWFVEQGRPSGRGRDPAASYGRLPAASVSAGVCGESGAAGSAGLVTDSNPTSATFR